MSNLRSNVPKNVQVRRKTEINTIFGTLLPVEWPIDLLFTVKQNLNDVQKGETKKSKLQSHDIF